MSTGLRSRNPGWKTFIPFGGLVRIPSESESHSAMSDSLQPHGLHQNTAVGSPSLLQGMFPTQGSKPGLLRCQADSSPAEPQGKPKNTGEGSLSLLQWSFLTQELNWGLLHCRWILYQLSWGKPHRTAVKMSLCSPQRSSLSLSSSLMGPLLGPGGGTHILNPHKPYPKYQDSRFLQHTRDHWDMLLKEQDTCWLARLCLMTQH